MDSHSMPGTISFNKGTSQKVEKYILYTMLSEE